uniref:Uncharacterized protein n=1 Tax=viral metagenome TaxID=1070528 RepID=A0A6M3XYI5_9ZZZZ
MKGSFKISLNGVSDGNVVLDGIDISRFVRGLSLQARVGNSPVLMLDTIGTGLEIEGEAVEIIKRIPTED